MRKIRALLFSLLIGFVFLFSPANVIEANNGLEDLRIAGADRYDTAVEISKRGWKTKSDTVILVRGDTYPDALSAVPFAKKLDAPILLTLPNRLMDVTKKEIERLNAKKVIIIGGPNAVSTEVQRSVEKIVSNVERISGDDRYLTSLLIAEKFDTTTDTAVVATGQNFADALAVAPYAAENEMPILLTQTKKLNDDIGKYLNSFENTIVVGGETAVSKAVVDQLPNPTRLAGDDRFDTAAEIIRYGYDTNENIFVSTGMNFADSLTGAVLASKEETAILLVHERDMSERVEMLFPEQQIRSINVLGGPAAVSDEKIISIQAIIDRYKDVDGAAVLGSNVKVLNKEEEVELEKAIANAEHHDNGNMSITISQNAKLAKYKTDDIMLIPPNEDNLLGFIAQIGEITEKGSKTELIIGQPAFEDIFENIKVNINKNLTMNDIIALDLHEGVAIKTPNGEQSSTFEEFQSELAKINKTQSNPNFFGEPIEFSIAAELYKKEISDSERYEVFADGIYELTMGDVNVNIDKKRTWFGVNVIDALNFDFKAEESFDAGIGIEWSGDLLPDFQTEGPEKWFEAKGVDRDGRITLASVTFNGGSFVFGEKLMEKTPLGVNVFVVMDVNGEVYLEGRLGFVEKKTYDMGASWDSKKGFDSHSKIDTHESEIQLEAEGNFDISAGPGLDAGINIFSVIPAVVENDLSAGLKVAGNGHVTWNFTKPSDNLDFNGCFDAQIGVNFTSTYKAKLALAVLNWDLGTEYEKVIFDKQLYGEQFDKCFPSGQGTGTVTDAVSEERLADVKITAYKEGQFYRSAKTDENGTYAIDLQPGVYSLIFEKENYKKEILHNAEVTRDGLTHNPQLRIINNENLGEGVVSGAITNAISGSGIDGATIEFREGVNTTSGEVVKITTTDRYGNYEVTLDAGNYTGTITRENFVDGTFTVVSVGDTHRENQNGSITPILDGSEYRIILTWGQHPWDLDSHLYGPALNSNRFHLYWNNKNHYENGELMATLDVDDRISYGPETITIKNQKDGTYEYVVHDYTNRFGIGSTGLANSNAKVALYKGSTLIRTFHVPSNGVGSLWKVFNIEGDQIIPINEVVEDESPFAITNYKEKEDFEPKESDSSQENEEPSELLNAS